MSPFLPFFKAFTWGLAEKALLSSCRGSHQQTPEYRSLEKSEDMSSDTCCGPFSLFSRPICVIECMMILIQLWPGRAGWDDTDLRGRVTATGRAPGRSGGRTPRSPRAWGSPPRALSPGPCQTRERGTHRDQCSELSNSNVKSFQVPIMKIYLPTSTIHFLAATSWWGRLGCISLDSR